MFIQNIYGTQNLSFLGTSEIIHKGYFIYYRKKLLHFPWASVMAKTVQYFLLVFLLKFQAARQCVLACAGAWLPPVGGSSKSATY